MSAARPYLPGRPIALPGETGELGVWTMVADEAANADGSLVTLVDANGTRRTARLAEVRAHNPHLALLGQTAFYNARPGATDVMPLRIVDVDPQTGTVTLETGKSAAAFAGATRIAAPLASLIELDRTIPTILAGWDMATVSKARAAIVEPLSTQRSSEHDALIAAGYQEIDGQYLKEGAIIASDGTFFGTISQTSRARNWAAQPIVAILSPTGEFGAYPQPFQDEQGNPIPPAPASEQLREAGFVEKAPGIWLGLKDYRHATDVLHMALVADERFVALGRADDQHAKEGPFRPALLDAKPADGAFSRAGVVITTDFYNRDGNTIGEIGYGNNGRRASLEFFTPPTFADLGVTLPLPSEIAPGVSAWDARNPSSDTIRSWRP